jgi:hypothetical protein
MSLEKKKKTNFFLSFSLFPKWRAPWGIEGRLIRGERKVYKAKDNFNKGLRARTGYSIQII